MHPLRPSPARALFSRFERAQPACVEGSPASEADGLGVLGRCGDDSDGSAVVAAQARTERLLLGPRVVLGIVGLPLLALLSPSAWAPGLLVVGLMFVCISWGAHRGLSRSVDAPQMEQLVRRVTVADGSAVALAIILIAATAPGPAMILLPLFVFELTIKYGAKGARTGLLLVVTAMLLRIGVRIEIFREAPRPDVITLILGVTSLLLGLPLTLRAEEQARVAALSEKERIRLAFRSAVTAALLDAGVQEASLERRNLEHLLDLACRRAEVGPEVGRKLASLLAPAPDLSGLTRREREILALLKSGMSDKDIAVQLFLSPVTVRVHVSNILRKLGASTREQALVLATKRGSAGWSQAGTSPTSVGQPGPTSDEPLVPRRSTGLEGRAGNDLPNRTA